MFSLPIQLDHCEPTKDYFTAISPKRFILMSIGGRVVIVIGSGPSGLWSLGPLVPGGLGSPRLFCWVMGLDATEINESLSVMVFPGVLVLPDLLHHSAT